LPLCGLVLIDLTLSMFLTHHFVVAVQLSTESTSLLKLLTRSKQQSSNGDSQL
jgi:hypothetical protein